MQRLNRLALCIVGLWAGVMLTLAPAQESNFKQQLGAVKAGEVDASGPIQVPYITWGGDVATFHANGGLKTKPGSIFEKQGLNVELTAGDDFQRQVKNYIEGKSPFLRGTFRMIGLASEAIAADPRTKGVVVLQMTWSAGDHMVSRGGIKTVADLKGKKIALQSGGPHIGMLDDVLKTAQLTWDDVTVVWAKDLTGSPNSPAEMFRKQADIDACFVITPDMIGLTGGMGSTGSGAEGTVKDARVLVSTAELSRSIADVYVCRKDFYDANKEWVTKFVAGYMKASEELVELQKKYEDGGSDEFMALLKMTQEIYGRDVIPTLEEDAYGLIADCSLVGYPGNVVFFGDKGSAGFEGMMHSALDLATDRGYASVRAALFPSGLDYQSKAFIGYLSKTKVERGERFVAEAVREDLEALQAGGGLDDRTILSFDINFAPNQTAFSADLYGSEYQRVLELSEKYGNAVFAIRGHADPTKTLVDLVKAGMAQGILKRSGSSGNYTYSFKGRPLDLEATRELAKMVDEGAFDGAGGPNPRQTMQAALNLSRKRAEAVRQSIIDYASGKGKTLDASQIQPIGVGIVEPFIAKPTNMDEAGKNRRVEFRLMRVPAEAVKPSDFDF